MTKEELINYLEKRQRKIIILQEENKRKSRGLGGDYLVTEKGKINDAFFRGKLEIISAVLERLKENN